MAFICSMELTDQEGGIKVLLVTFTTAIDCFHVWCTFTKKLLYETECISFFHSQGMLYEDRIRNVTYCIYESDKATGYGVGGFLFLLSSESVVMVVTKCMCFGRPLTPGGNRAWSIIYFILSWFDARLQ